MLDKLKIKYSRRPLKGDIYNLRNLKLVTDEILLDFMQSVLKCKLNNLYTDFTLAVGITSTILAAFLAYFSTHYEFEEYKTYLIFSLIFYCGFNSVVYICDLLRTTTFKFTLVKENEKVEMRVCTDISPPNPVYTILVYKNDKLIPEKWSKSVFDLFNKDGVLQADEFLDQVNEFFNKK
ncbi:putative signal peptidase complex subunit 2 [Vairimorpha necatrix]|uniref:Signal peptidase complex subunit 2 n=1 Tax=Vairimorpha necatrix TaxID=6039 RepID=A0AAX4JGB5_9MICR